MWEELDRLERVLSRFVETSDVARVAALSAGQSTTVGIELIDCLRTAGWAARLSGGRFDVTYASRASGAAPALLAVDEAARRVTALRDGVRLDLGGVGKGYALDRAAELLRDWGLRRFMLHAGQSTVLVAGDGAPWLVALRDPAPHGAALGQVRLAQGALAGSGRSLHGEHVRDAHTGEAPPAEIMATWALAPTAARADALSTALLLMTEAQVAAVATQADLGGARLTAAADGQHLETFGALPAILSA